jgi:hypothetical protein
LSLAVSERLRRSLPAAVQAYLEEEVQRDGTLEILHEDNSAGGRYLYHLRVLSERFSLHFAKHPPDEGALTGDRVRVTGVKVGSAIALASTK